MKVFMIFNTYIATIFSKNAAICSDTSGSITIQSAGPDHESLNFKAMSHNGLAVLTSLGNLWEMRFPAGHIPTESETLKEGSNSLFEQAVRQLWGTHPSLRTTGPKAMAECKNHLVSF